MEGREKERTWIQCRSCGNVYQINKKVSIEKSIVEVVCPRCHYNKGLNCGYSEMDVLELKDYYLDERYFSY